MASHNAEVVSGESKKALEPRRLVLLHLQKILDPLLVADAFYSELFPICVQ